MAPDDLTSWNVPLVHARVFQSLVAGLPPGCQEAELELWIAVAADGKAVVSRVDLDAKGVPGPPAPSVGLAEAIERLRLECERNPPEWQAVCYRLEAKPGGFWNHELEMLVITGGGGSEV